MKKYQNYGNTFEIIVTVYVCRLLEINKINADNKNQHCCIGVESLLKHK